MDERAFPVTLGSTVRTWGAAVASRAVTSRTCGHVGARFISGGDPAAGVWCVDCGHAPLAALLLDPWCALCDDMARPGLTALRAGPLEVLARLCGRCLTRNTPTERTT
ncbi:hypothetical protein [Streptomyces sp. CAI-85]|uniref:hypothetical protein n=1 Tax=Streptomyces sp. CAI-85 TaxID=1472662 RepID=UPI0015871F7A|nr:hypothetical protein [Streptomyces sp. CAI-85]NUV64996.1 hypothetical protein [Streptomyces sp. CAI-85]